MSGRSPAGAAMGKKDSIQRRSWGPALSEVGDKLVLRHHKRQACFLRPKDVSCKSLLPWKPGCWGGRQAAYTQLSFMEAAGGRPSQHSRENTMPTEMLASEAGGCVARGRGRSNAADPPSTPGGRGGDRRALAGREESNTEVDCRRNSCAAAMRPSTGTPARCPQEGAGS